jgi:hypothetical protein
VANPPTGTLTFLFTDIEGSTKMWENDAQAMQAALASHDELLRWAIAVVCWSGICGLGSIEIGSLGPINTLPFDHKSGSPESLVSLLPDINKPPLGRPKSKERVRARRKLPAQP